MYQDTAILLFTRTASSEQKAKNLGSGISSKIQQKVFDKLITKTKKIASKSQLPVIEIDSNQQLGNSFGTRFANAIQKVFDLGYQKVIAIGSDTPDISKKTLQNTAKKITKTQAILGPSTDGGSYLIGFHKNVFCKQKFANLAWQTPHLQQELTLYFEAQNQNISTLKVLMDIDSSQDLIAFLSKRPHSLLGLQLAQLLVSSVRFYICDNVIVYGITYLRFKYNRPPPALN